MPAIRDFSQAYGSVTTYKHLEVPMPDTQSGDLLVAVLSTDTGTTQAWTAGAPIDYVFSYFSAAWNDYSPQANDNTTGDWYVSPVANTACALNDEVDFGSASKFNSLRIMASVLGAATTSPVFTWEYYNGTTWGTLTTTVNTVAAWKTPITVNAELTFTPPANWATVAVNGVTAYWIRARCTTIGTYTTRPVMSQAWLVPVTGGWTQLFSSSNTANLAVMYKVSNGATEVDTGFFYSIVETVNGSIISVRDVDTTTPFNGSPGYAVSTTSLSKANMPTLTTDRNSCLLLYLAAHSAAAVPSILEGPCTFIFGKDGTAHSDSASWSIQAVAGTSPSNVGYSAMSAAAARLAVVAINPPSTGATVIPAYCASDSSTYISPLTGAAYNSDAATTNTVTTDFGTVLNSHILATAGTTVTYADTGINSYHAMSDLTGLTISGRWGGNVMRFATANKPNVAGKNLLFHTQPYMPVGIQTTDSVALAGTCGVSIGLCSTAGATNAASVSKWWHVAGAATPWGTQRHVPVVINTDNTTGVIQTNGSLDATSIYSLGFAVSAKNVIPHWLFGSCWLLDTTVIAGGNAAEPIDIPQIAVIAGLGKERKSVVQQGSTQMLVLQPLQFGDGGTNPTYLKLDSTAIEFPKQYDVASKTVNYCSIDNVAGITYYAGAGDTIIHSNSVISSQSRYHWQLHSSFSTSVNPDFTGLSVIGAGTISLARAVTISGLTINSYSTLDISSLTLNSSTILNMPATNDSVTVSSSTALTSCTITVTTLTSGNYWVSVGDPSIFTDCSFVGSASTGHAIRITTAGTYSLVGNTFSSFGADGTTSAAIFNDSGGSVTLNISAGGNVPTVRNGTSATTIVNNTVSLEVNGIKTGSEPTNFVRCRIEAKLGGPLSAGTQIMNQEAQTAYGSEGYYKTVTSFNYTATQPVVIRARYKGYIPFETTGTITANGLAVTAVWLEDTNFTP